MSKNICVVGSARMDFVVPAPRSPRAGETVVGGELAELPGGHGLCQAVMASGLGAQVSLVGCVGDDPRGSRLRTFLAAAGVDIQHLRTSEGAPTGVGMVTLLPDGSLSRVVAPGADLELSPKDLDEASKDIRSADVVILQGEVSEEANVRAIELAREGTQVVVHASPPGSVGVRVLDGVDLLVASREESCALLGDEAGEIAPAGLARRLACLGPERVVITLGAEGAIHFNGQEVQNLEGIPAELVDGLAVEDAFVGALAVLRAEGARLKDAVRFACGAAALAGSTAGGCEALPNRERIEELLRKETRSRSASG